MCCVDEYSIFGYLADINWCILPMMKQLKIYDNEYALDLYEKVRSHIDCVQDYIAKGTDGSERWVLLSKYLNIILEELYKRNQYGEIIYNKSRCDRYIVVLEKYIGPCIKLMKSIIKDREWIEDEEYEEYEEDEF